MKSKKISRVLTALLAAAFAVSLGGGALAVQGTLAAEPGVTLSEVDGVPRFTIVTDSGTDDLFQDAQFKNLMPGDTVTQTVRVRTADNQNNYRIFLYARECGEAEDGRSHVKPGSSQEVLDNIRIRVYQGEGENRRLISEDLSGTGDIGMVPGQLGQEPVAGAGALLGTFAPNHEEVLTVELQVNIEAGNEFANKAAYIDWVFYADTLVPDTPDDPGSGGGGGGGGGGTPPTPPANPDVTIEDPAVPLAEEPPTEEEIEEEGVPLASMPPETGDTNAMIMWLALAVLSGGGMIAMVATGRKKEESAR